jgi:hypothetical protein
VRGVTDSDWDGINQSLGKLILLGMNYYFLLSLHPGFTFQAHGSLSRIFFSMILIKILIYKILILCIDYAADSRKNYKIALKSVL